MRRDGFTLIELLVVVAIIVALLAILSPALGRAIYTGHLTVCMANIRQQQLAQANYASDHFGLFASRIDWSGDSPDYHRRNGDGFSPVTTMRGTYVADTGILICPIVAGVPQQFGYAIYSSNDWTNGSYGGWDSGAANVYTAYMWFAGHPTSGITFLNGTPPFPQRVADLDAGRPFITHRLSFHGASSSHEITHGGRGLAVTGVAPLDDYQASEMPVGFGDGSGILHSRAEMTPRYHDSSGATGTYIW